MDILLPILIIAAIGLLAGVLLAVAAHVFAVPTDEKVDAVRAVLPGANCGACGYSGCDGYAKALVHEGASTGLCAPGGEAVAAEIAGVMGVKADKVERSVALVRCGGNHQHTQSKMIYSGAPTCRAANQLFAGPQQCAYGCLGFGDCAAACPFDAIRVCDGLAVVIPALCKGCKTCVAACPKGLIAMVPVREAAAVRCQNKDKGGQTRKICSAGCIGCMRCVKACEFGAVMVQDFCAQVDPAKCTGCGKCVAECPQDCISLLFAPKSVR